MLSAPQLLRKTVTWHCLEWIIHPSWLSKSLRVTLCSPNKAYNTISTYRLYQLFTSITRIWSCELGQFLIYKSTKKYRQQQRALSKTFVKLLKTVFMSWSTKRETDSLSQSSRQSSYCLLMVYSRTVLFGWFVQEICLFYLKTQGRWTQTSNLNRRSLENYLRRRRVYQGSWTNSKGTGLPLHPPLCNTSINTNFMKSSW
jgi:hypothetical protein